MKISNTLRAISLIAGIMLAFASHSAIGESTDVTASGDMITAHHRYTMGDNDSKSDATTICFLEAKRKAIEYAGSYVESEVEQTQTDTSRKAKSRMKTIAASLVSSEIVSVDTGLENGRVVIDCVVNAKVDKRKFKKDVAQISADPEAKKQIEQQQIMLKKLEDEILKIQTRLSSASGQKAVSLRQERTAVFKEIDRVQQRKLEIVSKIESKGRDIQQLVTKGMTEKEVLSLVGKPRAYQAWYGDGSYYWNYGLKWIVFQPSGLVDCIADEPQQYLCH